MRKSWIRLTACVLTCVAVGCASQQQQWQTRQPGAIDTALQRARFDMSCPTAAATVLSQDFIQPAIQGPWVAGMTRMEYTIGVEGCNQRRVYIVMCQEGTDTCFATSNDPRLAR